MSQKTETVKFCSGCFNYFRSLSKTFFQYGCRFPNNEHLKEKKQTWYFFSFFLNGVISNMNRRKHLFYLHVHMFFLSYVFKISVKLCGTIGRVCVYYKQVFIW